MPLIKRIETDMFVFADVCTHMVNPVNLKGVPGAGLAKEFATRAPKFIEPYKVACQDKTLRMGTILTLTHLDTPWDMILLPTKEHYKDPSDKGDIVRGLEALRDWLRLKENQFSVVGIPMLGCGLGRLNTHEIYPLMLDHLGDLDATVILSLSPHNTEIRPRYLTIVGPEDYGSTQEQQNIIEDIIDKAMTSWGISLTDYEDVVSGGLGNTDFYIGGRAFRKDYENSFVYRRTGKIPLVVSCNTVSGGLGAKVAHNHLLCEIAHDIILFKPIGYNNNRMTAMQQWIQKDKEKRKLDGHPPRRVAVYGEHDAIYTKDPIIIPMDITGSN